MHIWELKSFRRNSSNKRQASLAIAELVLKNPKPRQLIRSKSLPLISAGGEGTTEEPTTIVYVVTSCCLL